MPRENTSPSLADVIKQAINNTLKDTHTAIVGIVESFDPALQTVKVQPAIKRVFRKDNGDGTEDRTSEPLPLLINVPVIFPRAGGYFLTFPIIKGDECLLIFSERSIDYWWTKSGVQDPGAFRQHDLSDAICFVGLSSKPNAISSFNANEPEFRNSEGDQKVVLKTNKDIHIITPTQIKLDSDNVLITGDITINGTTQMDGSLHSDTTIAADTEVSGGGIDLSSHVHSGVTTGGSNTGEPV